MIHGVGLVENHRGRFAILPTRALLLAKARVPRGLYRGKGASAHALASQHGAFTLYLQLSRHRAPSRPGGHSPRAGPFGRLRPGGSCASSCSSLPAPRSRRPGQRPCDHSVPCTPCTRCVLWTAEPSGALFSFFRDMLRLVELVTARRGRPPAGVSRAGAITGLVRRLPVDSTDPARARLVSGAGAADNAGRVRGAIGRAVDRNLVRSDRAVGAKLRVPSAARAGTAFTLGFHRAPGRRSSSSGGACSAAAIGRSPGGHSK